MQGLLSLAQKHPVAALERACQLAIEHGAWRLRDLRELLERAAPPPQQQFTFLESHPLIRDLKTYADFIDIHQTDHHQYPNHDQHTQTICTEPAALGVA